MAKPDNTLPGLCLFGDGRMSRALQEHARTHRIPITRVFTGDELRNGFPRKKGDLKGAVVGVDFSGAEAVAANVHRAVELDLPLLVGTTGWQNMRAEVEASVINGGGAVLYAPSLSFAALVLFHLVRQAAWLFDADPAYDPWVVEQQHAARRDVPGGAALHIGEILLDTVARKNLLQIGPAAGPLAPNQLSIATARGGYAPGTHQVGFDGPGENLELIHRVRDRRVHAAGAVRAALWLRDRSGFFTIDDFMADIFTGFDEQRESPGTVEI